LEAYRGRLPFNFKKSEEQNQVNRQGLLFYAIGFSVLSSGASGQRDFAVGLCYIRDKSSSFYNVSGENQSGGSVLGAFFTKYSG
jgi:hypothetical protein